MLIVCPRYNTYSSLKPEVRMQVKEFMNNILKKLYGSNKTTICLEDELAVRLFGQASNIVAITQKSDVPLVEAIEYYGLYTNEFISRYPSVEHKEFFKNTYQPLNMRDYKDKDAYLEARRRVYKQKLLDMLGQCVNKEKAIIIFSTGSSNNNWVQELEHEVGDGLAIIYANISEHSVRCYYGGISIPIEDMQTILNTLN